MTTDERNALLQQMLQLFKEDIEQSANPGKTAQLLQVLLGFLDGDVIKVNDDGEVDRATSDAEIIERCNRARRLKTHDEKSLKEIVRAGLLIPAHR